MSAPSFEPYCSPCSALFGWEQQVKTDANGTKRYRMRDATGNLYSHPGDCLSKNDVKLRGIFLGAGLGIVPLVLLARIPLRLFSICCGDFAKRAYEEALKAREIEWINYAKNNPTSEEQTPVPSDLPSDHWFRFHVFLLSVRNLAIEIGKIAIYPLASIALLFAGLWGAFVNPTDAGKMWSDIEYFLAQGPQYDRYGRPFYQASEFLMPCRQPLAVAERYEALERFAELRHSILGIKNQLQDERALLAAFGINVDHCMTFIRSYQESVLPTVAACLQDESAKTVAQQRHLASLKQYQEALEDIISMARGNNYYLGFIKAMQRYRLEQPNTYIPNTVLQQFNQQFQTRIQTLNATTVASFTEPLNRLPTNPAHQLVYDIEKLLMTHRKNFSQAGINVDENLRAIRSFAENNEFSPEETNGDRSHPLYNHGKQILVDHLRHLRLVQQGLQPQASNYDSNRYEAAMTAVKASCPQLAALRLWG